MSVGENIKAIRVKQGRIQKELYSELNLDKSSYSKLEKGMREVKINELQKIASIFEMTIDDIVNFEGKMPKEVTLIDKTANEQMKLIAQLDQEDKQVIFKIVDTMLTKKKFQDFFKENMKP